MNAEIQAPVGPSNSAEIFDLEYKGAQFLCAMIRGGMQQGQMPPKNIFEWYGEYCVQGLIAIEQVAMSGDGKAEDLDTQLARAVPTVAEVFHVCKVNKLMVLEDKLLGMLKTRRLRLPPTFDPTYEGMLPQH